MPSFYTTTIDDQTTERATATGNLVYEKSNGDNRKMAFSDLLNALQDFNVYVDASSGTAITIDPDLGQIQNILIDDNCTITLPAAETVVSSRSYLLNLTIKTPGGHTISVSNIDWASGVTPTFGSTTDDLNSILVISSNGSNVGYYLGNTSQDIYSGFLNVLTTNSKVTSINRNQFGTNIGCDSFFVHTPTIDNIDTTAATVAIPVNVNVSIVAKSVLRRTGGTSGTANDGGIIWKVASFRNTAGTVSQLGNINAIIAAADGCSNTSCDLTFDINGTDVEIKVRGDTDNNYSHFLYYDVMEVA